jgi:hypothetical protein
VANEKSGRFWVSWANENAKNSSSVNDLAEPFQSNVKAFLQALKDAGCDVTVSVTRRSGKRAYLFHWSWLIGLGKVPASDATPLDGVDIDWDHGSDSESQQGAREMIEGFGLAVPPSSTNAPALNSNHIDGQAIDMAIEWTGTANIAKKDGAVVPVEFMPNVNKNIALHLVGASYGVRKLITDTPHWSFDGH